MYLPINQSLNHSLIRINIPNKPQLVAYRHFLLLCISKSFFFLFFIYLSCITQKGSGLRVEGWIEEDKGERGGGED